jgi:hypothetical protein
LNRDAETATLVSMQTPWSWMKRLFGDGRRDVLALITPEAVRERGPIVRYLVAGGTLVGMLAAGLVGLTALAALLLAVGVIYFLVTQVLGLQVNVDPQAFYQQFYRQATQYGAN